MPTIINNIVNPILRVVLSSDRIDRSTIQNILPHTLDTPQHQSKMLFPNILDPKCFSKSLEPPQQHDEQGGHGFNFHFPRRSSRSETAEPQPRRFSFARRHSDRKDTHPILHSEPDHEPEPIPSPPLRRTSTSSSRLHLKTPDIHIQDLSLLLTQMIAPSTFLYSLPTREPYQDIEAANKTVEEGRGHSITRVDSIHVEAKCREDEGLDDCTGVPICREAEIAKWKNVHVPAQRWSLY